MNDPESVQELKETRNNLVRLAREHRRKPTPAEDKLWQALCRNQIFGYSFRRQRPIARFLADFCCDQLRLIIEVDGNIHDLPDLQEHDDIREKELIARGFTFLRLRNEIVLDNFDEALSIIKKKIEDLTFTGDV